MNWVKRAVADYVSPPPLTPSDVTFGGEGFEARIRSARGSTRAAYWVCVVLLVVLFVVVLIASLRSFDQLVQLGAHGLSAVTGVFGLSAAGCVSLMMRWSREIARSELLLALLQELLDKNPTEFNKIVSKMAHKWYGLTPVIETGPRKSQTSR